MSRTLKFSLVGAILLLLVSIPLAMQREGGGVDGRITSGNGPIVKASVEARNVMSGAVFRAETDATGHYSLRSLAQGRYSLWVKAPGYDSVWIRELIVERDRVTHRDIHLGKSQSGPLPTGE